MVYNIRESFWKHLFTTNVRKPKKLYPVLQWVRSPRIFLSQIYRKLLQMLAIILWWLWSELGMNLSPQPIYQKLICKSKYDFILSNIIFRPAKGLTRPLDSLVTEDEPLSSFFTFASFILLHLFFFHVFFSFTSFFSFFPFYLLLNFASFYFNFFLSFSIFFGFRF